MRSLLFLTKRDRTMDLLYQAAQAWKDLTQYTYRITYGQNKTLHTITLKFCTDEFYHLAGFQYTKDVVLPVRFSHTKTLDVILSGKITEADIAKSENYPMIAERLTAITKLKAALDTAFIVYQFNPKVLPFYTNITAKNLICAQCGDVVFLFTDNNANGEAFSKSVFLKRPDHDFSKNQKALTIFRVERENGGTVCLYSRDMK